MSCNYINKNIFLFSRDITAYLKFSRIKTLSSSNFKSINNTSKALIFKFITFTRIYILRDNKNVSVFGSIFKNAWHPFYLNNWIETRNHSWKNFKSVCKISSSKFGIFDIDIGLETSFEVLVGSCWHNIILPILHT